MLVTWSATVAAAAVSRHAADVVGDGPGQVLDAAFSPSTSPAPIQSHAQSFLLTVTEHRDPSEHSKQELFVRLPPQVIIYDYFH